MDAGTYSAKLTLRHTRPAGRLTTNAWRRRMNRP